MSRLVLEYVFEGHRRGYNFTTPTDDYDEETLKTIWRHAMARGQGWGKEAYVGARSIKTIVLPGGQVAVSEVTVTDLEDESGRRGIRRAVVDVMPPAVFNHHVRSRLLGYPVAVQKAAHIHYNFCKRQMPRLRKEKPFVLTHPFKSVQDWWIIEALVLMLVSRPIGAMQRWETPVTFTTLALDYRNESRVVALPYDQARQIQVNVPILPIR